MKDQDNGYKSVLKEYDFYNNTENDFEIIDEFDSNYFDNKNDKDKDNNNKEMICDSEFKDFIVYIFKIIFKSRNQISEFHTKSKSNLNEDSFQIDLDELFMDYKDLGVANDNNKKKYFIDFYLVKKDKDEDIKLNNFKSSFNKQELLVERWKVKYREKMNINQIKDFKLYLKKKMKILEKSIVEYTRLLPLYNILKNDNYSIDFTFCPKRKKKFVDKKSTNKIKLINENLFSFKLSIKYLKITPKNIDKFMNKITSDFVIIHSKQSRRRFLSDDYQKKSSAHLLENLEKSEEDSDDEDTNKQNKIYNDNHFDARRLSYEQSYTKKNILQNSSDEIKESDSQKYIHSKFLGENKDRYSIKIENSGSICSKEDNFILNIEESGSEKDIFKTPKDINKIIKKEFTTVLNNNGSTKEITPRKSQTYNESSKFNRIKSSDLYNLNKNNSEIKKILIDYKNVRRILKRMPDFDDVKNDKLSAFISNNFK